MSKLKFLLLFAFIAAKAQDKNLDQYVNLHARNMGDVQTAQLNFTFLDSALKNARIVMLGESSHGTEEYSLLKKELIQYLHEKLGFNVVLFESPMINCSYFNMAADTNATDLVKNSIQSVWHTEAVRQLFSYIKAKNIRFGGFDPQHVTSPFIGKVYAEVFSEYPQLVKQLQQLDARISETIPDPHKHISLKDSFATAYSKLAGAMQQLPLTPLQQWIRQAVVVSAGYYARITKGDQRDADMARNITWLAENLYKGGKIIVWAHNTHIDKNATSPKRNMGKLVSDHFKDEVYSLGLYMINGQTAENNREVITIKPPPGGSIEQLLGGTGFKTAFLPTGNAIFNRPISTLHWGKSVQKINLYKSFNGIILINGVRAPNYLSK